MSEYYRGEAGRKYGIYNTRKKCFQFGIVEDSPCLAEARLFYKIGQDARRWRFVCKKIPNEKLKDGKLIKEGEE